MGPTKNPAKHMLFDCVCHKGVVNVFWQMLAKDQGLPIFIQMTQEIFGVEYWCFFGANFHIMTTKKIKNKKKR